MTRLPYSRKKWLKWLSVPIIMQYVLVIVILNLVYQTGFFLGLVLLKVNDGHYFFGFGKGFFSFHTRGVKFTVGFYIPIVFLSSVYVVSNGVRQKMIYPWEQYDNGHMRRFCASVGGVVALFAFAFTAFVIFFLNQPEHYVGKAELNRHGIYPSDVARRLGFEPGDKIVQVNGKDFERFSDLVSPDVLWNDESFFTIERNGEMFNIFLDSLAGETGKRSSLLSLYAPFEVGAVLAGSPAAEAGLMRHDRIVSVNNKPVKKFVQFMEELNRDPDGTALLEIRRHLPSGDTIMLLQMPLNEERKIGIATQELVEYTTHENTFFESVSKAASHIVTSSEIYLIAFLQNIAGVIAPVSNSSEQVSIDSAKSFAFLYFTGAIALWYVLWNFLPLPKSVLWEIVAIAYEVLFERRYPHRAFEITGIVAWVIFILHFTMIIAGDVIRFFRT
jgi:regulator of sigma E protease